VTGAAAPGVEQAADRLHQAAVDRQPCPPVRELIGPDDLDAAYAVQLRVLDRALGRGERRSGRKIGLTSEVVQVQLGVDQPDFGYLLEHMAVPDGGSVADGRLLQPRIEADVAGWDIRITDTVADNASAGAYVLSSARRPLGDLDLATVQMELACDGEVVSAGTGEACLGDPLLALQWLARTAALRADPLRAGDVVLTGALGAMVPVRPGSTYTARLEPLGTVSVRFAAEDPGTPDDGGVS
jgi:2-keto-4-pentenoate hydratase